MLQANGLSDMNNYSKDVNLKQEKFNAHLQMESGFNINAVLRGSLFPTAHQGSAAGIQEGSGVLSPRLLELPRSDGMGANSKAPRLIDTDFVEQAFSNDVIRETILKGTDKMPSQKNNVNAEEITEIIKYLRYSQKAANLVTEEDTGEEDEDGADEEK